MKRLTAAIILLGVCIGYSAAMAQETPDVALRSLHAAEGLELSLWASEPMVNNPTGMDIDSRGRVWIAEGLNYRMSVKQHESLERSKEADRIKILEDTDGDGMADSMKVFADQIFPVPLGLAVEEIWNDGTCRGTRVYVGNAPNLLVLEDTDGDDHADRRYPLLTGFHGIDSDHGLHGMTLAIDGKLYFTQGDARYGADKIDARQATLDVIDKSGRRVRSSNFGTTLRVNLDGTHFEVLTSGQRNNYETALDSFGNIFCSDNDDDGNRGCRMIWNVDGGKYGYQEPRSTRHWAEELPGIIPKLVGTGNGAPGGLTVYEGDLLPAAYSHAIMQVDAGTHQVNMHRLVRHGAGFRSDYEVLVKSDDSWFRPVDVTVAPDGSVFICDWYDAASGGNRFSDQTTGRIYRLAPKDSPRAIQPLRLDFDSLHGLVEVLRSPNNAARFAARQALVARGEEARSALQGLLTNGRPHERARALQVLADLPKTGRLDVLAALGDQDPRIRECALQILVRDVARESLVEPKSAITELAPAAGLLDEVLPLADDPDSGVRRILLMGLRNVSTGDAGSTLSKLAESWDGQDRFYLEAVRAALKDREGAFLDALFKHLAKQAVRQSWNDDQVAMPPFFPITSNDAFLRPADAIPASNAASKILGLAWGLERPEALASVREILQANSSPSIEQSSYVALSRIEDPRAGEILIERYSVAGVNRNRQRELLKRLGAGMAGPWKSLSSNSELRKIIAMALQQNGLQIEAMHAIAMAKLEGYGEPLLELTQDESVDLGVRSAAIEVIGKLHFSPARPWLMERIQQSKSQSRGGPVALASTMAMSEFLASAAVDFQADLVADREYPLDVRRQALQLVVTTTAGVERMLKLYELKKLPEDLVVELQFLLHNHADRRIRQLAKTEIPIQPSENGKRIHDPQAVLALQSDPNRGRVVFHQSKDAACARCHRVQGEGTWLGPDLSSIGTKYGPKELLYHILNPSGAINYNYVARTFLLDGGRVLNGLVISRRDGTVVLKMANGEQAKFEEAEIEEETAQSQSLMPEGLAASLTEQELADLVDYLSTLNKPVLTATQCFLLGPLKESSLVRDHIPDLRTSWDGVEGKTSWQLVSTADDGQIDLSSWLGAKRGQSVFVYLPINSPIRQDAVIAIQSQSPIEMRLDTHPITFVSSMNDPSPILSRFQVQFHKGINHVVMEVKSGSDSSTLMTTIISNNELCSMDEF